MINDLEGGQQRADLELPYRKPAPPVSPLTRRELEVLQLIGEDLTTWEIAERLYISTETVKTHSAHIIAKLNVHTRVGAVAQGFRRGLIK